MHACGQLWDVGLVLVKPSRCSLRMNIVGSIRVKNLRGQSGGGRGGRGCERGIGHGGYRGRDLVETWVNATAGIATPLAALLLSRN